MNQSPAPGMVKDVTVIADPDDISLYLSNDKKTMVLFEMTACPYCRMFQGRLLDFARSRPGEFAFLCVTLDDPSNPLWQKYEIHAVPTVIVFANAQITSRLDSIVFLGITKKNWHEFCAGL